MMTFFLVVKMMLPITENDKETRSKFQRFLFNGFADKDELKAAILANNPRMDTDQRSLMEKDIENLQEFISRTYSIDSVVGGMVQVVDVQDYAFVGQWRFNQRRLSVSYRSTVSDEPLLDDKIDSI